MSSRSSNGCTKCMPSSRTNCSTRARSCDEPTYRAAHSLVRHRRCEPSPARACLVTAAQPNECVAYLNDACTKLLDCADSLDGNGVCSAVRRGPIDERASVVCAPNASIAYVSCGWACLACRRRRGFRSDRPNMRSSCRHFQLRSRRAQGSATASGRRSGGLAPCAWPCTSRASAQF